MNVVFLLLHPYIQGTCVVYVSTCTPPLFTVDLFYFLLLPLTLTCCTTLRLHFFGMPQMPIKASTLLCSPNIANSANIMWGTRAYSNSLLPTTTTLQQLILFLPLLLERSGRCRTVLSYRQRLSSSTSFPRFDPTTLLKTRYFRPDDARGFHSQCDN